jgi:hypothetical protein
MASVDQHIHESLRHLAVRIDALTHDPKNARKHNERNLDAIRASLKRFGFRQPLVVQEQGMIVRAGNGRLQVARELGWATVPCLVVDESEAEATAFALADNRTSDLAEWDSDNLASILEGIHGDGGSVAELGWADHEFTPLIDEPGSPADDFLDLVPEEPPKAPPKEKPKTAEIKFRPKQWATLTELLGGKPTATKLLAALKGK